MPGKVSKEFPLEEEYKKNTGITPQDVARLRDWLKTQPHLPEKYITDLDLILIYHCCEKSTEVSKQVLDLQYTLRTLFSGFFKDRKFDKKVDKAMNTILFKPLPARTDEGYACFYVHFLDYNPKNFVLVDSVKALTMVLDLWQYEEGTWPGFIFVVDMEGMVAGHLGQLDLQSVQQFFYYLQEAMLVKMKSFHFLNAPPFMDKLMMILRPFIKKELLQVLHIHQAGAKSFGNFFPLDALPKEAGGCYKSLKECNDEVLTNIKVNPEFFEQENKKRVVEALRPGKPKTVTDFFGGMDGSFKKLDID